MHRSSNNTIYIVNFPVLTTQLEYQLTANPVSLITLSSLSRTYFEADLNHYIKVISIYYHT